MGSSNLFGRIVHFSQDSMTGLFARRKIAILVVSASHGRRVTVPAHRPALNLGFPQPRGLIERAGPIVPALPLERRWRIAGTPAGEANYLACLAMKLRTA
jgi:hypothetical protein